MNINEMTLGELKEINSLFTGAKIDRTATKDNDDHWKIGESYLIRTVTHIQLGKLVKLTEKEIVLDSAAWIADTGRFHDALANGIDKQTSAEIEPFEREVIINRGALIDATEYKHKLPKEQK